MIEASHERYLKCRAVTDVIDAKLAQIRKDTAFLSNPSAITSHPQFGELVAMGDRIIPYIFHVMIQHGCSWVHIRLLGRIIKPTPIKPEHRGRFYHIVHDWLGWYLSSPYCESDIYYGLVEP